MAEITSLQTVTKSNIGLQDFFVVANSTTKKAKRLQVQSMFSSLATAGTGGESIYTGITNKNQLNFKGIKSGDTGLLTVATTDNNLVFTVLEAGIDLSLCNNDTAKFLTSVDLSVAAGTLAANRGGTGLTTIPKGCILYGSDLDTVSTLNMSSNGNLLIGNATTGLPTLGTLTSADASITITNSAGGIDLQAASTSALKTTLDCSTYSINLNDAAGDSWLSGDGTSEGVHVDADGYVFIGDTRPTLPTLASQLTLGGSHTTALTIGNINNYGARTIKFQDASGTNDGLDATIRGADAHGTNKIGGDLTITAGSGTNITAGGALYLQGGGNSGSSGKGGALYLQTADASNNQTSAITIAGTTQAISISKDTTFGSGVNLTMNASGDGMIKPGGGGIHHSAPVVMSDANGALTLAANGGRTTIIPNVSDDRVYTLPDPTTAGEYYHIVGFGALAADGHDITIQGVNADNTTFFHGAVVHHDTNNTGQTSAVVWGNGSSNDTLKLDLVEAFDLHFLASSSAPTTMYYVWGWTAGATPVTITD